MEAERSAAYGPIRMNRLVRIVKAFRCPRKEVIEECTLGLSKLMIKTAIIGFSEFLREHGQSSQLAETSGICPMIRAEFGFMLGI